MDLRTDGEDLSSCIDILPSNIEMPDVCGDMRKVAERRGDG